MRLTDIRHRWPHLIGYTIVLAEPEKQRLAALLDYRAQRWPNTTNPRLLIVPCPPDESSR
jgi:hypothetical protein